MARPAGYSSEEEDELDGFLDRDEPLQRHAANVEIVDSKEHKLQSLLYNIMSGNVEDAMSIINEGIDVNEILPDNWSALLLAASVGNAEIASELIKAGADVNSQKDKYTALMAACNCPASTSPFEKSFEIVEKLLEHNVDINETTKKRMTAFMYAARSGNILILEKLYPLCDPKLKDNQGWTALFHAVNANKPEAVKFLLDKELSADAVDIRGNSPLDYAVSQNYEEIAELLPNNKISKTASMCKTYSFDDFYREMETRKRPRFFNEVCTMLHGMKSEQLTEQFAKADIDLLGFLQLNEKKLIEIGIEIPYQRKRILYGLHRFHNHPYKSTSIPIIPIEKPSTMDVRLAIVAALRHVIIMKAAINYLHRNYAIDPSNNTVGKGVAAVKYNLKGFSKTVAILTRRIKKWDESCTPVDRLPIQKESNGVTWLILLASLGMMGYAVVTKLK